MSSVKERVVDLTKWHHEKIEEMERDFQYRSEKVMADMRRQHEERLEQIRLEYRRCLAAIEQTKYEEA